MKKIVCLALALLLALGILSTGSAAPFALEAAGVTIEVPEGMTGEDISNENQFALGIKVDEDPTVMYIYALVYFEEFAGKMIEDLSSEQITQVMAGAAQTLENPQYDSDTFNGVNVVVMADGGIAMVHYITVINGWVCDVCAISPTGEELTSEQYVVAGDLLTGITFLDAK